MDSSETEWGDELNSNEPPIVRKKKRGKADGGLRGMFFKNLKAGIQWTPIETGEIISGVPDSEFISETGVSGWIEFKSTPSFSIKFRPAQPAWIHRRARYRGRVFIAVIRAKKELWIVPGDYVLILKAKGLNAVKDTAFINVNNPGKWNWKAIRRFILGEPKIENY